MLDQAGLIARAKAIGFDPTPVPPIAYVSPTGDLSVVDRRFRAVLSSHAIEHQPDLVAHLNGVERLLAPGGLYHVIAPDKRYCFDQPLPESTVADVLAAHAERRTVHTAQAVLAHHLEITHNTSIFHWLGLHGRAKPDAAQVVQARADAARAAAGEYVDVHAWIFSPARFLQVMQSLRRDGLIGLDVVSVHETGFGQHEYFAVLRRP